MSVFSRTHTQADTTCAYDVLLVQYEDMPIAESGPPPSSWRGGTLLTEDEISVRSVSKEC